MKPRPHTSLLLAAVALAACATTPQTGIMAADWTPPADSGTQKQRVAIAWESDTRTTGEMTFTLGRGGQRYVGSYLLIEQTRTGAETAPVYAIWNSASFATWSAPGAGLWFEPGWPMATWVEHYDGRVVVGLHGDRDGSARCQFTLTDANAGMVGGGTGECQVSDGGHLSAHF